MKFVISYFFAGHEEEGVQTDIVEYKDKKSCIEAYNTDEYENVEIEEYDENAILEDMYSEQDDDLNEHDEGEYDQEEDYDADQEGLSILFPNADTEEELEEELEHSFSRMMDN
ncbi:MAG: hypothetical protein LKF87_08210 [Clostridium tyrobutyricum]|jgi:hypothetical protein|nr:hypothetical protein [Clostridium tyrobutyricum]MCH4258935.1 hypothetical protein [Clostridium tyrobutyricum]MCI1239716.1 hypothetical protein [Clostridium tyrobutyricum]MCI1651501.1 hypothetical protein [Clostridium tyrobutyricum]